MIKKTGVYIVTDLFMLSINSNNVAITVARNLNNVYKRLAKSTERLSSGLRINSSADDAAGLAIREMMRSDIHTLDQGIRNASDAISLINTAEGALAVIDEKLIRMKELAEQAATGTYTTIQREIINSEYQAMYSEIKRIAKETEFNGIKLLDGSLGYQHRGSGLKVHFGAGNESTEDYYFIRSGDATKLLKETTATVIKGYDGYEKKGEEFQVNTYTASFQAAPSVASFSDGGFVIAWHSFLQDGDLVGVYGQTFDAAGKKSDLNFRLTPQLLRRNINQQSLHFQTTILLQSGHLMICGAVIMPMYMDKYLPKTVRELDLNFW